jgi:hypothetical protein
MASDPIELFKELQRTRFWGNVAFDFRDGQVILIRKTESFKPGDKEQTRHEQRNER